MGGKIKIRLFSPLILQCLETITNERAMQKNKEKFGVSVACSRWTVSLAAVFVHYSIKQVFPVLKSPLIQFSDPHIFFLKFVVRVLVGTKGL